MVPEFLADMAEAMEAFDTTVGDGPAEIHVEGEGDAPDDEILGSPRPP